MSQTLINALGETSFMYLVSYEVMEDQQYEAILAPLLSVWSNSTIMIQ